MVVASSGRHIGLPPTIHFEAPSREGLAGEVEAFLAWFKSHPGTKIRLLAKAPDRKSDDGAIYPGVRIPLSPPRCPQPLGLRVFLFGYQRRQSFDRGVGLD